MSKSSRTLRQLAVALAAAALAGACGGGADGEAAPGTGGRLRVVATTGMVADAARRVGGDRADVVALMGPGVDPHLYKASEGDVSRLTAADLVLYNGLHLEGKMGDVLVKLARSKPVVAVSETVPQTELREPPEFAGQYDPHIWFDVRLWSATLDAIAAAYAEVDPAHADAYRQNAEAYRQELLELDAWVAQRVAEVPPERRILVTAHDAFGYFGRAYGLEVRGVQGISTVSQAGVKDIEDLTRFIVERRLPAVFVETSVSDKGVQKLVEGATQRGHAVTLAPAIFSDSTGPAGTFEGTYLGMIDHNVTVIARALGATGVDVHGTFGRLTVGHDHGHEDSGDAGHEDHDR